MQPLDLPLQRLSVSPLHALMLFLREHPNEAVNTSLLHLQILSQGFLRLNVPHKGSDRVHSLRREGKY